MTKSRSGGSLVIAVLLALGALTDIHASERSRVSASGTGWPAAEQWTRVLTLRDHNTRVVVLGTTLLGIAAGVIGSFTLLRKRALMGDALSHATLPGIGLAFLFGNATGLADKSLPLLLFGAAVSGVLGVGAILFLRRFTRIREDAALGVVLGVFFGAGIAVLGIVQQLGSGAAAGLSSFIYGKTASMVPGDVALIAGAGLLVVAVCLLLFKEFQLLCFDQAYAGGLGWPVLGLDVIMMALVVIVTVIGLQAVGLILVIALLIIPAAAARFWTERMAVMLVVAAALGGVSALVGAGTSALFPKLPSGAMIVIVAAVVFGVSMLSGTARGVVPRALRQRGLQRKIGRQNLLRALYEITERRNPSDGFVAIADLLPKRSWSVRRLHHLVEDAKRSGFLIETAGEVRLSEPGRAEAERIVRNHRLWEMYLITHADVAASHVDRDADMIEHVLDGSMIAELEALVAEKRLQSVPASPHVIGS